MSDERVERIKKMEEKLDKVTPKINAFLNIIKMNGKKIMKQMNKEKYQKI